MGSAKFKTVIDIGNKNTKIIEIEEKHGDIYITKYSMFKTPEETFEDGLIKFPHKLADLIEREFKLKGFRSKSAIATISSPSIMTREVVLPKVSFKDMTLLVDMEAPNHFPLDISQHSIDFKVLGEVLEDEVPQYKVLILVTPVRILESYVALFEKCGLFIEKIDYKGNSIAKLLKQHEEAMVINKPLTYAVLDIGCDGSSITICKSGIIKYSRALPFGSHQYNNELISLLNCTDEEADNIKYSTGIPLEEELDSVQKAAYQAWEKLSIPFFDEVTRVFDFFTSRENPNTIDKILLTGGGSLISNLISYMNNSFDTQIDYLTSEGTVEFVNANIDLKYFSAYFANCVGAVFDE